MNFKYLSLGLICLTLISCNRGKVDGSKETNSSGLLNPSPSVLLSSTTDETNKYGYTLVEPHYKGTYYNGISPTLYERDLILALDALLDKTANNSFTYSKLFDIFAYTDVDKNTGKLVSFYSGTLATKSQMNREHVWPNSRGGNYIENDPHMTRPTLTSENSARGNDFFNEDGKWDPASFGNPKYRGIAARIIFYCAVKQQEKLYLVDKSAESNHQTYKTMGKLSTLLKWNFEYPIDETEILRNDTLFNKYNHARNPFIDDRNYACKIWGYSTIETMKVCTNSYA